MSWVSLCEKNELAEGKPKAVDIEGVSVGVWLYRGKVAVMDDVCPHAGASLMGGWVEETASGPCAVCPHHQWKFSMENGAMPGMGEEPGIGVYPVREKVLADGRVLVQADLPIP